MEDVTATTLHRFSYGSSVIHISPNKKIEPSNIHTDTSITISERNKNLNVVRRNRIEPQSMHWGKANEVEKQTVSQRNGQVSDVFNSILCFGLIIGMPVSYTISFGKRYRLKSLAVNALLKTWQVLAAILHIISTALGAFNIRLVAFTNASRMFALANCLSGQALIWIFLFNRRRINDTIKEMRSLQDSSSFCSHRNRDRSRVKTYLIAASLQGSLSFLLMSIFYFNETWHICSENIRIHAPVTRDSWFYSYYPTLVVTSFIYSFSMSTMILHFTIVLCGEVYHGSAWLLSLYRANLRNDIETRQFRAATAIGTISHFKRIASCIFAVVNIFGRCIFFIFYDLMDQFFGSVTLILTGDTRYQTISSQVLGAVYLVMGIVMLFYLLYSCEKVRQQSQHLKKKTGSFVV